ncbi:Protein of unknown function [Paenimyroides aquimaris]|uniref:DUF3060 domain-containing protein n=1 Tax=Paenimyroides marinum TaxID=1159016 RepID=A0A1H6MTQ6_9FLAO|nr:DUF3060 domain-containing protein [Paenimyroides aquimaris]SEI03020.1 Protein of unknown function [Paenimyroides aquimaris]
MKKILSVLTILCLGIISVDAQIGSSSSVEKNTTTQKEIVIEGVGITKTVEATGDEAIRIEGTNNKVTITGACNTIKIEGVDNTVTVDDVKSVSIEGTGNKVNYKKTSAANGKLLTAIAGVNNKITKI